MEHEDWTTKVLLGKLEALKLPDLTFVLQEAVAASR